MLQNGLGYDAFMTKLEDAAPSKSRIVVTMADVLGVHGKDANPHLWYDVPQLDRIAERDRRCASSRPIRRTPPPTAPGCIASSARSAPLRREVAYDPVALPRRPGRVHRAGPRLPPRGGRAAQPRARLVHAADRGGNRAVSFGRGRDGRADREAPDPRAPLQQPGRLPHHRAAARRGASAGIPVVPVSETLPPHLHLPAVAARPGPRARGRTRDDERRQGRRPRAPLRRAHALRRARLRARARRAARGPGAERHRQDVADPDPARAARAERRQRRDRGMPAAGALPPDRLRAAAAGLRPRPRPARTRPRAARARRPPLGLRPLRRRGPRRGSTRRSPRSARRRTRTRRSGGSRAASSSGCAWRRRSSPTRC